jgi:hypothetical protein
MGTPQRVVAAAALALVLTSCGGGEEKGVSGAPTASSTPSPTKAQATGTRIELPNGLAFRAPEGWTELSKKTISGAAGDMVAADGIKEMAGRMGVTPEQLVQQIKSLDTFVTAPGADRGFLANLNALHITGDMPSDGSLELQYRTLGAKDITIKVERTAVGAVRVAHYLLELNGVEIHGGSIAAAAEGDVAVITVSTGSDQLTEATLDHVLETLTDD